jgi:F-type H+-transporting ATPase subunit b
VGTLLTSLNIDPQILLYNGILFLALLVVMDRLFWKKVMAHLDKRKQDIASAYETVDATRRELDDLQREYQGRLNRIEGDARARIQQTVREAQAQREQILAAAHQQAEEATRRGEQQISFEHGEAVATMRGRLADVAADAIAKVTGEPAGDERRSLVQEYISREVTRS